MSTRTDLALEAHELHHVQIPPQVRRAFGLTVTSLSVTTPEEERQLGKPAGTYVTVEGLKLTENVRDSREHIELIAGELRGLLPEEGMVLVAGLGNLAITPDALGPRSTGHILATRHITGELARASGLDRLRAVAVISPGVLGQTGIETGEILVSLCRRLRPAAVIAIDALAARRLSRLGTTLQISNTGISPGSGVGNHRMRLNERTIGVPVIAIGVPTVVDAETLACDLLGADQSPSVLPQSRTMMVTPRETDVMISRAARLVGMAVNCALQPRYDPEELAALL